MHEEDGAYKYFDVYLCSSPTRHQRGLDRLLLCRNTGIPSFRNPRRHPSIVSHAHVLRKLFVPSVNPHSGPGSEEMICCGSIRLVYTMCWNVYVPRINTPLSVDQTKLDGRRIPRKRKGKKHKK